MLKQTCAAGQWDAHLLVTVLTVSISNIRPGSLTNLSKLQQTLVFPSNFKQKLHTIVTTTMVKLVPLLQSPLTTPRSEQQGYESKLLCRCDG